MMIIKGEDLQREEQLKIIDMVANKYSKEIHYALLILAHEKQKNRTFIA